MGWRGEEQPASRTIWDIRNALLSQTSRSSGPVPSAGALWRKHMGLAPLAIHSPCAQHPQSLEEGHEKASLCLAPLVSGLVFLLIIYRPQICLIPFCCLVALCFDADLPSPTSQLSLLLYCHVCTRVEEPVSSSLPQRRRLGVAGWSPSLQRYLHLHDKS